MAAILGIDAAWTPRGTSGVALVCGDANKLWLCRVAPSYDEFIDGDFGASNRRSGGTVPKIKQLVNAAQALCQKNIDVIAVDMPMSRTEFSSRRAADNAISRKYGSRKASTHSPNRERPGELGRRITSDFNALGFPLVTSQMESKAPALIEVYPHVALIECFSADERLKYKIHRSHKLWPGASVSERIGLLLGEWRRIVGELSERISGVEAELNLPKTFFSLASMKPYEDCIDAIVSAWVGIQFWRGSADPYGDADAAIWVPR